MCSDRLIRDWVRINTDIDLGKELIFVEDDMDKILFIITFNDWMIQVIGMLDVYDGCVVEDLFALYLESLS